MLKKRRHNATLIELIIAMTLTMLILSTMAYFYRQMALLNSEMEVQQTRLFKQLFLSTRLMDVLPKTISPQSPDDFYFYTADNDSQSLPGTKTLVFSFQNGIKLNTQFSGNVLGKLFVDKENRLCLNTWPSPARWEDPILPPMKSEILMENVGEITFSFFIPQKEDRKPIWDKANIKVKIPEDFPESQEGEWVEDWKWSWGQLPALVKIRLRETKNSRSIELMYPLPNNNFFIVY